LRAVNPRGRGGRQASAGICANKSSLATIFANPIYRGIKVFNKETRVDGEHGRRRRRNPQQDVVTVATVRDLFERVDVDSRELKAVAIWNGTTRSGC
jgi:hypothetical protein